MTIKEIVDAFLKLVEILTGWPIVLLTLVVLFKREIQSFLPEVGKRLTKAEIVGSKFEFSEIQRTAVSVLPEVVERGVEEYKDKPEQLASFIREQVNKLPKFQSITAINAELNFIGRSVLWVDDKPMNNIYEANVLKRLGTSIVFARSTDEALAFLAQDRFDLIISDIHRNEKEHSNLNAGYELLEMLDDKNRCPLIFYISDLKYLDKNRSKSAYGAVDTPNELIDLVVRALQYSSVRSSGTR